MPRLLICQRGHQWESPSTDDGRSAEPAVSCPFCESVADTATGASEKRATEATTLPPGAESEAAEAVTLAPAGKVPAGLGLGHPSVAGYDVLEELGRGGMGIVYKARQLKLNRLVALKMILPGSHASEQDLARFAIEAEAVAGLRHPHIVQIYDIGEQDGMPYFSLEFVEGGTLEGRLNGTPWLSPRGARLVETLARAIHAAHQQGIVHRDLKPSNVLLTAEDTPKIADFGLAKRLNSDAGQTRTGTIMGTPSYMAPEQAGHKKMIGPAADVYALGAVLYELLTGRPPFRGATPLDTVLQVVNQDPVPPSQLNATVPRDLETICLKCLEKEPARRYASAEALAEDLRRFLAGEHVLARPVGRIEKLGRWCRRNPLVAGLTAAVVLVLLGGTVISSFFAVQANRRATEVARRLYVSDMLLVQRAWEEEQFDRARRLLDRQEPARTGGEELRGFEWYYWDRLCRDGLPVLQGHRWPVQAVAFNTDGSRLASAGFDLTVKVWDLATGRVLLSLEGHEDTVNGLAFSPDGRLASASSDRTVKIWDPIAGRLLATLVGHDAAVRSLAFSPNGLWLASASTDRTVRIWDVATGKESRSLAHDNGVQSVAFSRDGQRLASAGRDMPIRIWNTTTYLEKQPLGDSRIDAICVAFSRDGNRLASGSVDNKITVWDMSGRGEVFSYQGKDKTAAILSVAFSPDGKYLAASGLEQHVRIWGAADGESRHNLDENSRGMRSVVFSPDAKHLAAADDKGTIRVWDADTGRVVQALGPFVHSLTFSLDGKPLDPTNKEPLVKVWDPAGGQVALTFRGHDTIVTGVAFNPANPGGQHLASIDWGTSLNLWCGEERPTTPTINRKLEPSRGLAFSPGGRWLALAGRDGTVRVVDAATGSDQIPFQQQDHQIKSVALSFDGRRLASAGEDGTVWICEVESRRVLHALRGHDGPVNAVVFSPDGNRLASAGDDGTARIWDPNQDSEPRILRGHGSAVTSVSFSPDGRRLASASKDRTVKIWNLDREAKTLTLKGHSLGVNAVAFCPSDKRRLASASDDETIKLWETADGQEILTFRGHTGAVTSLAFSKDGQRLASSSKDKTVRIWRADSLGD
jgi:WD40 repeat protein/tRNA A-37 threonylcarbamoyl transferase component Bud32